MSFMPDWAPNVHPMIVHFPIALLFAAVLVDLLALFVRRIDGLHYSAVALYVLGALASYFTGKAAADSQLLQPAAE